MSLANLITKSGHPNGRFNLPDFNWHYLLYPAALVLLLMLINLNFGITDAGNRTDP